MSANAALYRYVDYIGGNILDAQNVISFETQELTRAQQGIGSVYQVGTLLNAQFVISGTAITLECANVNYPILVFVRGTFETLVTANGTLAIPTIPSLTAGTYPLFLNWSLDIKTYLDDGSFVDGTTDEPTIQMGQINISVSWTDTSAIPLNGSTQFEKNTATITLANFVVNSMSAVSTSYVNGVYPYALANTNQSGLVTLTDNTGIAVGTTDPRLANDRSPGIGTIFDEDVASLIETNGATSPPQYDPTADGQGGIFTDHIIYVTLQEKLTDFLDGINAAINSAIATLAAHIGQPLGSSATHPFPTAAQVGAAPASHVGQVLGLATSHPAQVNDSHNGFTVLRNSGVSPGSTDYGYQITDGTNLIGAITHQGDVFASIPNTSNAQGGNGTGGSAVNRGDLGLMSMVAAVLAEHVNYTSHSNNNPHNLNATDIGAATTGYVDSSVASVLAAAEAYTDSVTGIVTRTTSHVGTGTVGQLPYNHWPNGTMPTPSSTNISYIIFTFGGSFEIAIGTGQYWTSNFVDLPESSGWSTSQMKVFPSALWSYNFPQNGIGQYECVTWNSTGNVVHIQCLDDGGNSFNDEYGWVNVLAIAWRSI